MSQAILPTELRAYKRTSIFDQDNMPAALKRSHETKIGVWGKIVIVEGRLNLRMTDDGSEHVLDPDNFGVVCPRQAHEVAPLGNVKFYVEFYAETPQGDPHTNGPVEPVSEVAPEDLRKPLHPAVVVREPPGGMDRALIVQVIDAFYAKVRGDEVIGPVFSHHIESSAWPAHMETMYSFWSSLLLGAGTYEGRPMPKHMAMSELSDLHFQRWLLLFKSTVDTLCRPEAAAVFISRAERIAQSFRLGLAFHRGQDTLAIKPLRAGE